MAATVDNSVRAFSTAGVTSLTSASWTIGGSNRVLYTQVGSGDGTPSAPNAVKWQGSGGTSLTQQGSTVTVGGFWRHSLWRLIAPTAASSTSYASWASAQDEVLVISVSVQDADQTTPNNTVATATGNNLSPTVNATSVSGDLVLDCFFAGNDVGAAQTIAATAGQTSLKEIEGADTSFEMMGSSSKSASSASTTMSWTITGGSSADTHWSTFAFAVNAVSGGGGTTLSRVWWDMIGQDDV